MELKKFKNIFLIGGFLTSLLLAPKLTPKARGDVELEANRIVDSRGWDELPDLIDKFETTEAYHENYNGGNFNYVYVGIRNPDDWEVTYNKISSDFVTAKIWWRVGQPPYNGFIYRIWPVQKNWSKFVSGPDKPEYYTIPVKIEKRDWGEFIDKDWQIHISGINLRAALDSSAQYVGYISIIIPTVPGIEEKTKGGIYITTQSPNSGEANISYTINTPTNVKLNIYDITGRLEKILINGKQNNGTYKISTGKLSQGVHFYEFMAGKLVKRGKLVIR